MVVETLSNIYLTRCISNVAIDWFKKNFPPVLIFSPSLLRLFFPFYSGFFSSLQELLLSGNTRFHGKKSIFRELLSYQLRANSKLCLLFTGFHDLQVILFQNMKDELQISLKRVFRKNLVKIRNAPLPKALLIDND